MLPTVCVCAYLYPQMEFNELQVSWSEEKLELEKRLADLEAR
jgi:hypothetical protein